jgi:hypothetical protein
VDLSQTMIFMTSNLDGGEITELMTGGMGFAPAVPADERPRLDEKVEKSATRSCKAEIRAGIHEPDRQSGGVPSAEE